MVKPLLTSAALAAVLAGCGKGSADRRSAPDPALEAIAVDTAVTTDASGAVVAVVRAGSPNTQTIRARSESAIAGASLAFLPGSFDIDFAVSLEETYGFATAENLAALGLGASAQVKAAGPAVLVSWAYDEDSYRPYTLTLPKPAAPADLAGAQLVVIYVRNVAGGPGSVLGLLPEVGLVVADATVSLQATSYGAFQAIYVSGDAATGVEVPTGTEVPPSGAKGSSQPPGAFAIKGPSAALSGARPRVSWATAPGAASYEIKIDAASATCASPYATIASTTDVSVVIEKAKTGDNFVCVRATNAKGVTAASNSGFKFRADADAPPIPGKPTGSAAGIEVTFTWSGVEDVGPAGVTSYSLQVGTTAGGSDVFNGIVSEVTSKAVIGFRGTTYYARVRAFDTVGNESEWSAVSAGVRVD